MNSKIKLALADDHNLFRKGVEELIEDFENMDFKLDEEVFLQKNNIIISFGNGRIDWHDRLVKKTFEELRKKKGFH